MFNDPFFYVLLKLVWHLCRRQDRQCKTGHETRHCQLRQYHVSWPVLCITLHVVAMAFIPQRTVQKQVTKQDIVSFGNVMFHAPFYTLLQLMLHLLRRGPVQIGSRNKILPTSTISCFTAHFMSCNAMHKTYQAQVVMVFIPHRAVSAKCRSLYRVSQKGQNRSIHKTSIPIPGIPERSKQAYTHTKTGNTWTFYDIVSWERDKMVNYSFSFDNIVQD